ncbi:hypothetical protein H0H81_003372 [Sphagnurus paluster]|uniref:Uncharacterized protein n=1 Tax=Sphagnurus paluster TaxID=117069 RepID=A0A9P7FSX6_9AGAR|nr:hypothetical protein H0H81_003372 [Sphagnurus paluster]
MSTAAFLSSTAVSCTRTVSLFIGSLEQVWLDFSSGLENGADNLADELPFFVSQLRILDAWQVKYHGLWLNKEATHEHLVLFATENGLGQEYPYLEKGWRKEYKNKWDHTRLVHKQEPMALFDDPVPAACIWAPSMSMLPSLPLVSTFWLPPQTTLLPPPGPPGLLWWPLFFGDWRQMLGTQLPKSPLLVPGPSRHLNRLPSLPPQDNKDKEPPQNEDWPMVKGAKERWPVDDEDMEMIDNEPVPQEKGFDKDKDDEGTDNMPSPKKQRTKRSLEDKDKADKKE